MSFIKNLTSKKEIETSSPKKEEPVSQTCSISPAGLLTPQDAAIYLGVSVSTLASWRLYKRFDLPFINVGRRVMYRKVDLDTWIENRSQEGQKTNP